MVTTFKSVYGTADQAVTITLASLASSATAGRESTVVSNTTNLFLDCTLFTFFKPQAGSPANDKTVYTFVYGTNGGTKYPDNLTGADAACTPTSEANLLGPFVTAIAVSTTRGAKFHGSLAAAFGGVLPEKWGAYVRNYCGFALSATASDLGVEYEGIQSQGV